MVYNIMITPSSVLRFLLIICAVCRHSISTESHNVDCTSNHLSDNKTNMQILDNEIMDKNNFEDVRIGKLENSTFLVRKYPQDQKKCLLEICGYSKNPTSLFYRGYCQWYYRSSNGQPITVFRNIYKDDYDLNSASCSCTLPSSSCTFDNCFSQFSEQTWENDECAVLFRVEDCKTCHFPVENQSIYKPVYILNTFYVRSMIIRPGCTVDRVNELELNTDEKWIISTTKNNGLTPTVALPSGVVFHKVTKNFTCRCETDYTENTNSEASSNELSSTLEYITTETTSSSSVTTDITIDSSLASSQTSTTKDTQDFKFAAHHYAIIVGSLGIFVAALYFLMSFFNIKRKCHKNKHNEVNMDTVSDNFVSYPANTNACNAEQDAGQPNNSEAGSTSTEISEYDTQPTASIMETSEMKLKLEIMDEVKQLIDSLIPSTDTEEHAASPTKQNCESYLLQLNQINHPEYNIPRDSFSISKRNLENPLGSGQFGIVYQAKLKNKTDGLEKIVAVKKINWHPDSDVKLVQSFIQEVKTFIEIYNGNENIVGYIGACCHSDGLYILTEYCEHGSLKSYLSHNLGPKIMSGQTRLEAPEFTVSVGGDYFVANHVEEESMQNDEITMNKKYLRTIFQWCEQIACGMEYLGGKGIIHVDLAIRNILLSSSKLSNEEEDYGIKICDFGLSKRCMNKGNYAKSLLSGDFPFNSFAPECVSDEPKKISIYLDVWAYGCTIWEIFMLGDSLYPDVVEGGIHKFLAVKKLLQKGYKHPKPPLAPEYVYNETMLKCWERVPRNRPNFTELRNFFEASRIDVECV